MNNFKFSFKLQLFSFQFEYWDIENYLEIGNWKLEITNRRLD